MRSEHVCREYTICLPSGCGESFLALLKNHLSQKEYLAPFSLLGSAKFDDRELSVDDFFHCGEIRLIKKELLAMMIWVPHVKNLVFDEVPNRSATWGRGSHWG